jgi:hypothetical protein
MGTEEFLQGVGIAILFFIALLLVDDIIKKFKNKE